MSKEADLPKENREYLNKAINSNSKSFELVELVEEARKAKYSDNEQGEFE